jgi:hypothetical protein
MKRTLLLVIGLMLAASGCTYHRHEATHIDDPGTPENGRGQCYAVETYDEVHHGFLWLSTSTKNYRTGLYCLKE